MHGRWIVLTVTASLGLDTGASASGLSNPVAAQEPDFLFGAPRGNLAVRGGWLFASADSDVFDFFSNLLTIQPADFQAPDVGVDVAVALHPRLDAVVGLAFSRASLASEYREFVDLNDLPITQQTQLTIVPVTASIKLYLTPRGREVSRYAYIPAMVRPYVGGGGGFLWYELEQTGDFVDFLDLSIFSDVFRSDGFSLETHLLGGVEVNLTPRWFLSFEGRYLWSDASLEQDFVGFEPIDLSGLRATVAIHRVF